MITARRLQRDTPIEGRPMDSISRNASARSRHLSEF